MAITLTQGELSAAIRLGDSAEENAESARLLTYVTEAIARHLGDAYDAAPEAIVSEAAIRLAGYLFDQPNGGPWVVVCKRGPEFGRVDDAFALPGASGRVFERSRCSGARGRRHDRQPGCGRHGRLRLLGCHPGGRFCHAASPTGHGWQRGSDCQRCSGGSAHYSRTSAGWD